jgi:hypothetical protein
VANPEHLEQNQRAGMRSRTRPALSQGVAMNAIAAIVAHLVRRGAGRLTKM